MKKEFDIIRKHLVDAFNKLNEVKSLIDMKKDTKQLEDFLVLVDDDLLDISCEIHNMRHFIRKM